MQVDQRSVTLDDRTDTLRLIRCAHKIMRVIYNITSFVSITMMSDSTCICKQSKTSNTHFMHTVS